MIYLLVHLIFNFFLNNNIMIILLLFFILIIYYIILYINYYQNDNFINLKTQIGNYTCWYFTKMGISFYYNEDFYNDNKDEITVNDNKLPDFIPVNNIIHEELQIIPQEKIVKFKDRIREHQWCTWYIDDNDLNLFWLILKPTINTILNKFFINAKLNFDIKHPIIHFRCSDVPFVRSDHYKISKLEFYYKNIIKLAPDTKEIYICYDNNHNSNDENKIICNFIYTLIEKYFYERNIKIINISKSSIEDFANIFYAPIVISSGGSFSFMSGFFGNGKFISASHDYKNCNECYWIDSSYEINHVEINSYYNLEEIEKKLYNI